MFTERDKHRLTTRREKQPWPAGRPFKILSFDGGGIRGLFAAKVVQEIASSFSLRSPFRDYFDLIAGTSTGGIIAIALALGKDPAQISNLYEKRGEKIFPPAWSRFKRLAWARRLRTSLYDHRELERALKDEFGSQILGDSTSRLVIPAFAAPNIQVAVFKTDHHADYKRDWRTSAWEVARATSAAPTYLEGHRHNLDFFLDGGLWANNPVMLAIVEAVSSYDIRLDQIDVLSIGTGNPQPHLPQGAVRWGMFGWRNVIATAMYLTTDTALSQARLLLGWNKVVRVEPTGAGAALELDDWRGAIELMPDEARNKVLTAAPELARFFQKTVNARERHHSSAGPPKIPHPHR